MDLWVRIPRFPIELLNFDSIANMLVANNVGSLVKLMCLSIRSDLLVLVLGLI